MREAEATCQSGGLRLTDMRRKVLRLVWSNHVPAKAYDILEKLHAENPRTAPPTVYRALEFLMEAGLVHKIESMNAYVGCENPKHPHIAQFLICDECGAVIEINASKITQMIVKEARHLGFETQTQVVEIRGHCPECQA